MLLPTTAKISSSLWSFLGFLATSLVLMSIVGRGASFLCQTTTRRSFKPAIVTFPITTAPSPSTAFSINCISRIRTTTSVSSPFLPATVTAACQARVDTRLFASKPTPSTKQPQSRKPNAASASVTVEILPANHGTRPWRTFRSNKNDKTPQRQEQRLLDDRLVRALAQANLTTPTPIQAHVLPLLLRGDDVMASAATGSGKTLMFALPLVQRLFWLQEQSNNNNHRSTSAKTAMPQALILSPTRELAQQTATVLRQLVSHVPRIYICLATGGSDTKTQRQQMQSSSSMGNNSNNMIQIMVGTPGRVLQFVNERSLRLDATREIVVDEADRMLDLGFEPQLRRIARALGRKKSAQRHSILCSATFPPDVQRIASEFLQTNHYFCAAGRVGATHATIQQTLQWVDGGPGQRRKAAVNVVKKWQNSGPKHANHNNSRVVVFTNTKDEAERLSAALLASQVKGGVRVVHGDKTQAERNKSLADFRQGKIQTLVATHVAARGLDVPDIGLVVQMDAPRNVDDYVHRIGCTGRAGKTGQAVVLLDGRSVSMAPALVRLLAEAKQQVPAWLVGMSHVATVRDLQEQSAIASGGGSLADRRDMAASVSEAPSGALDEENNLNDQDFRSSAAAGSWGSERDTTYRSFEEAYKSLDDLSLSTATETLLEIQSQWPPSKSPPGLSLYRRQLLQLTPAAALATLWTSSIPSAHAIATSSDADFRTKAVAEYTNSITASRDTNVSPKEAYDSILKYLPRNNDNNKIALDVGAGAGLSTSYLFHNLGYQTIDAVDWSSDAWQSNVEQAPSSVRFYELDDDSFFSAIAAKQDRKYDVICYNFAINPSKAVRVARQYLTNTGVLFAPVNDRPEYWYKQTYYTLNIKGQVLQKSEADVGAWSVQFQPDVTSETCTGFWCGNTNGFFVKRKAYQL